MAITVTAADPARLDWHRQGRAAGSHRQDALAHPAADDAAQGASFASLKKAYRGHGGIAQADFLATCLSRAGRGGCAELARHLGAGDLFSFHWQDSFWVPLFQFNPPLLSLRAAPHRVLEVLHGMLDGGAIASWYLRPHPDLLGQRPLDLLDTDLNAVLAVARTERRAARV